MSCGCCHRWSVYKRTLKRDLRFVRIVAGLEKGIRKAIKHDQLTSDIFDSTCSKRPNKLAVVSAYDDVKYTFAELRDLVNRIGNIFYDSGYRQGDVVVLFMENRPEYVAFWLGLSKLGVITSLVNYNLKRDSLLYCISVANAKAVIFSNSTEDALSEIQTELNGLDFFCYGRSEKIKYATDLPGLIETTCTSNPPRPEGISFYDKLIYMYTSGTTGLPKPAVIRHTRFYFMVNGMASSFDITHQDTNYVALPLYHSNGGVGGIGMMIYRGTTVIIAKKFSASRFFQECAYHGATMFNYIGETCRYLLAQPPSKYDRAHRIRLAIGNGLRPQIWSEFKNRFGIAVIGECYASTEGNANMINIDNKEGAVGFNSVIAPGFYPIRLIKVDRMTGDIQRDDNGMAIACEPGEAGELVGKVRNDPVHQFDGYVDKESTDKKIVSDIFNKGDSAFRSGDILVQDEFGYFYFQDRGGDTFRWKGENVGTAEVEAAISRILNMMDVVVYGVEIPGIEGRAGMACIGDPDYRVDLNYLRCELLNRVPNYARPQFVRLSSDHIEQTETFKYKKVKLREEGFDPRKVIDDRLYYNNQRTGKYEVLDILAYQRIIDHNIRF
ncbi:long-chain fatty acid transport protein 1-like isoform X2 [Hydractinia symbiolongicarpus]|uniref:long-chain fatty acid transport protein 1-like isoform X2 n=1 Tax=Hydractinia symbiolongicarpus TaxID=13093 RepID=UPI00254F83D3|nr:long-chain fatty acid transport protein 1-like isoform X2 [Hydractinia symbiolongicarpus]